MFALLVMTDGRTQYIGETISSAFYKLNGPITEKWMHDDSGDENHRRWLQARFPSFTHIGEGPRRGFGPAYNFAWDVLNLYSSAQFYFNLEDDFTFNREVPLEAMAQILDENPHLYQMALRRQAWNQEEIKAGGIIERWPDDFKEKSNGDLTWMEHRRWYTTNPSLYRRSLIETRRFPDVKDAEGHFFHDIINSDPDAMFGYFGRKSDSPWTHHIGIQRSAKGTY